MELRGILSIGVLLTVIHVTHSAIDCIFYGDEIVELPQHMTEMVNDLSVNLYQATLNDPDTEKNFISSPLSAAMVLLMINFGARGSTADELNRFLQSRSLSECSVRTLTTRLNDYKNLKISLANSIFADSSLGVTSDFQASVKFASTLGIQRVNFAQPNSAVQKINDWCKEKTNSKIQELFTTDDINADTQLVVVNAIYFKGKWAQPFDKKFTEPMPFTDASGNVKSVSMMFQQNEYFYGRLGELSANFIELPYESNKDGDGVSMFVILPHTPDGLDEVEKGIRGISLERFHRERSSGLKEVHLSMPRFKIESKIEFTNILKSMGITEIFSDTADFSGISDEKLSVSKIMQKAFIEVNEEGTEAAAATGSDFADRMGPAVFNLNRPFLVLIATEDVILFSGRVTDPQE